MFVLAREGSANPSNTRRDWDRRLQLFSVNEEFLVSVSHQLALITSLSFVHTARRYLERTFSRRLRIGACAEKRFDREGLD